MYYFFKIILTEILVVALSEISKRSSLLGGALASLPLVSFLGRSGCTSTRKILTKSLS